MGMNKKVRDRMCARQREIFSLLEDDEEIIDSDIYDGKVRVLISSEYCGMLERFRKCIGGTVLEIKQENSEGYPYKLVLELDDAEIAQFIMQKELEHVPL